MKGWDRIKNGREVTRRILLSSAVLAGLGVVFPAVGASPQKRVSFGVITDTHYASAGLFHKTKFYSESLKKVAAVVDVANTAIVDFIVGVGNFINENEVQNGKGAKANLRVVEEVYHKFNGPVYHVLGNHDGSILKKTEFNTIASNPGIPADKNYYSFDVGGVHFVVLDSNYTPNGEDSCKAANIPRAEQEWLRKDLTKALPPIICFIHHPMPAAGKAVLRESGKVLAVFQSHIHENRYEKIGGTHYCHLDPTVEGKEPADNSFVIMDVYSDNTITIKGYYRALSARFTPAESEITGVVVRKKSRNPEKRRTQRKQ